MSIVLNFQDKVAALQKHFERQGQSVDKFFGVSHPTILNYLRGTLPSFPMRDVIVERAGGFITHEDFLIGYTMPEPKPVKEKVEKEKRVFVRKYHTTYNPFEVKKLELKRAAAANGVVLFRHFGVTRMTLHNWTVGRAIPADIPYIISRSFGVLTNEDFAHLLGHGETVPEKTTDLCADDFF